MVKEWSMITLIKLYKNKGDRKICDNYRGIALLNITSKIFSPIILNHVQDLIDHQLLETQSGFRSNRSTIDQIFTVEMTMEKRREFNKPLFMCFIDITKAYDSVNHELLWKVCLSYGITTKLVNLLKMLYKDSVGRVKINDELSDIFEMNTDVMQGGIPSPLLFNILFDFIIKKVITEAVVSGIKFSHGSNDFFHGRSERYNLFDILTLLYADDLVVMCETITDLEKFIRSFEKVTQQYGLTMNIEKACLISLKQLKEDQHKRVLIGQNINCIDDISINIRNQKVETVDSFAYLGCTITNNQLYGSETWPLTMRQEQRITTFYNKWLRRIIGINIGDRMSNETLLNITGQPPIEMVWSRKQDC